MSRPGVPALTMLTAREVWRFIRQPSRIVAVLGTPLLMWLFFGGGFAGSFALGGGGVSYSSYLLPGMISLAVMFSSIFAAMSLIDDRHAGFLQSALTSPAPRWAIAGSKVLGGALLALAQGALLMAMAPLMGLSPGVGGFALAAVAILLIAVGVCGLGLAAAWLIDSSQGFHGVMNMVLMPMWLLSGALFPAEGAAAWLRVIMLANPLYWPTAALRSALTGVPAEGPPWLAWALACIAAAGGFGLSWLTVGRHRAAGRGRIGLERS